MGLMAKRTGEDFQREPIPIGIHQAVCYSMIDLGTQKIVFEGHEKHSHQIIIGWEVPEFRVDFEKDGQHIEGPKVISKKYTLSLHERANLRKHLEVWRGGAFTEAELEGFDLKKLLGINCQLNIIHAEKNERTYANVNFVLPPTKDQKLKPENETQYFSFEDCLGEKDIPQNLYDWQMELIKASLEYNAMINPETKADMAKAVVEESPVLDNNGKVIF